MMAVRGTGQSGYLAIDDVEFFVDFSVETCQISPNEATPTTPGNLLRVIVIWLGAALSVVLVWTTVSVTTFLCFNSKA